MARGASLSRISSFVPASTCSFSIILACYIEQKIARGFGFDARCRRTGVYCVHDLQTCMLLTCELRGPLQQRCITNARVHGAQKSTQSLADTRPHLIGMNDSPNGTCHVKE